MSITNEAVGVQFPAHPFTPDALGHNCVNCPADSAWKCDPVAHGLGAHEAGLKLLDEIRATK